MALTGYYKTMIRPRTHRPLSMLKYDPVGMLSTFTNTPLEEGGRRQDGKDTEKMEGEGRRGGNSAY